jgi:putative phosphoribosyl transferase
VRRRLAAPLFEDRAQAGRALAAALGAEQSPRLVVIGLARGGMAVAAEVARVLVAPLDAVAVRKVGHPWQPEYAIAAVTPGDGVYVRPSDGLTPGQLAAALEKSRAEAVGLDGRLHVEYPALSLDDRTVLLVDDGLATGATMIAAIRWARAARAARVVVAVPVAAAASYDLVRREADEVVALHLIRQFVSVGTWYGSFSQLDDAEVIRLIGENRRTSS